MHKNFRTFFAICCLTLPGIALGEIYQDPRYYLYSQDPAGKEFLPKFFFADAELSTTTTKNTQVKETPIISHLKGIVIYGNSTDVNKVRLKRVRGVTVKNLYVPGGVEKLQAKLDPLFLHKSVTQTLLQDIKKAIVDYYVDHNQPLVIVSVPEQNVSQGVLQLVVTTAKLGKVQLKGNKYFTNEQLLQYLNLEEGNAIDYDVMMNNIDWMNRNPFRHTDLYLTPGIFPGTTNVELLTNDRYPVDVYVGADNTGYKQTGYQRVYGGINATNFFGLNHIFNYQYTLSPRWPRYQANVVNYTIPFSWKHILVLTLGYEKTSPAIPQFNCITRSLDGNLRYIIPIHPTFKKFMQEVVFGLDFEDNMYKLRYLPADFTQRNRAVMTNIMGGYNFSYQFPRDKMVFSFELFYSPGGWLPHMSNATYQKSRPFSDHTFVYGKLYLEDTHRFKNNYRVMGRIKGQLADRNLLFGQYILGDYYSVRGYKNEFGIDNAFVLNTELQFPEVQFLKSKKGQYFFLFFYDYAIGGDHKPIPGLEPRTVWLMSVGPGFRFQIDPYFWARLDVGFPLSKLPKYWRIVDQQYTPWAQFGLFLKF